VSWNALTAVCLLLAALLDTLLGDPVTWLHPVQVMGTVIQAYSQAVFALGKRFPLPPPIRAGVERGAGILLFCLVVGGSGLLGWGICTASFLLHWAVGLVTATVLLASCLARRSLADAAADVLTPLSNVPVDLPTARLRLSQYVGRDTANLDAAGILRAVLETVTENAIDGVFAPLFYILLGLVLPEIVQTWGGSDFIFNIFNLATFSPIFNPICVGVGCGLAYKAASTLDSCVGYRKAPYTDLGWCSARCEDGLTWPACRFTVVCLALLSGRPRAVLRLCQRDAPQDPSPNSGWSIGIYAAILKIQLGGMNAYQGQPRPKPLLGEPIEPVSSIKVQAALGLTRRLFWLWVGAAIGYFLIRSLIRSIAFN
jgi:adenosylcobinamide-phosphate synthase